MSDDPGTTQTLTPGARLVVVHPDAGVLAEAAAARLLTRILDVQSVRSPVHVVLTGGTVGIRTLACVAASPLVAAVDWSGVHLWWGDERFLPDGDPDRNETQAREALVDALVAGHGLPGENVHPVPGPSAVGTPEEGAAAYAAELARFAGDPGAGGGEAAGPAVPAFDVLLLGMGPDGHVASLFPGHEGLAATGAAVGVHGSPKPPPERVSLTFGAIRAAREVWVVAAGGEKAAQAAAALGTTTNGAPGAITITDVPAAGAVGRSRTLWLLDAAAAGG
ncbi:6-phosphogluconolactonase [Myceligenerans pegani]|uniref:6-phosphogluconolactonase n=1 Tax=Myceligenerans pegani TaxID=2776917 RepID=A0ABR9N5I2_9MICO|nr:6-phosphogluconolactonase [Myceligenerans sp. TRM 65318]MBE1878927.1 6-phosphogluconolactonase [Myceligenerans sp. TRM 65318]MBE3021198.1 6-phosphogluconolactonase [Myceligenerans sp. TRM 65318]